ncbi:MAG: hypothetical protein GTO46_09490 [Gemmatimonadetes bacterium]|nr:hypothetical protein [Gemmatimonadota bacterium]NIO31848.1 hypothetical protein [Gemmatimonadota bacterium]
MAKDTMRRGSRWERAAGRLTDRRGLALVATLLVLTVMAVLVAAAVRASMTTVRTSGMEYHEARVFYAAEAGAEVALSQLKLALQDGYLSDSELTGINPPALEEFSFDSFSVQRLDTAVVEEITDGPYSGLWALTQNVEVYSLASDPGANMSGVVLAAKAQAIPIFQFGVFYEEDLEATNGPPMTFVGRVHSNGDIYLSSRNAWYMEMITTPNKVIHNRKDQNRVYDGVYVFNPVTTDSVVLDFDSRTIPGAEAFKAESWAKFNAQLRTDAFDVDSLRLPLPPGVPAVELIRPREMDDGEAEKSVKFAWNADTYVTVDLTDLRRREAVCGAAGAPPDEVSGEIMITQHSPVYPGAGWVTFTASHPLLTCDEFDSRVTLRIDGDEWQFDGTMSTCTFQAFVGDAADVLEIEIEIESDNYGQLADDIFGNVKWLLGGMTGTGVDQTPWPNLTVQRPTGLQVPSASDVCRIFQWDWSAFYDGREQELKDVLNIDVIELANWSGADSTRAAWLIYVEFVVPANINTYPQDAADLIPDATVDPAIRLVRGGSLPNPMTVATEWPVYVRGNYNNVNKQPTALAGDGITILSNAWDDGINSPSAAVVASCEGTVSQGNPCTAYENWNWVRQNAAETTVNAAVLAGHWPTPCDWYDSGCPSDGSSTYYQNWYGGGIENFPRFLERWRGASNSDMVICRYRGALVSPFTSQKTTGTWNGTYYVPPQREWSFDTDFRNPRLLPPGTPNVGYVLRTAMREAF